MRHRMQHQGQAMSQLTVISSAPAMGYSPPAQAAHDLRNLLATVALHVETLQRLSGPSGAKASDAAHALLTRGAAMCNNALDRSTSPDGRPRRRAVDVVGLAREIADLLAPAAPEGFSFDIAQNADAAILADPDEVFRILFNLMSNAVTVANREASTLRTVAIDIGNEAAMMTIRVADDGPGLPECVRTGIVPDAVASVGGTAERSWSRHRARACRAQRRHSDARGCSQRRGLHGEASGAARSVDAGGTRIPRPPGNDPLNRPPSKI